MKKYILNFGVLFSLIGFVSCSYDDLKEAVAQPPLNYTFYYTYGHDTNIDELPYRYGRSKFLRCPEVTKIKFKTQILNKIDFRSFQPSYSNPYGPLVPIDSYVIFDYNIKLKLLVQNVYSHEVVYSNTITLNEVINEWREGYFDIELPQGFYEAKILVEGSVKNNSTSKLDYLNKLMSIPRVYLHLDKVTINSLNVNIPNNFGNSKRLSTFISL
ncbi:MAG: hypothetical protein Q4G18_08585 [Myroides sp.]|nr:hypothetical protein [Myroides sp.]